ncbi:MAG: double-strand break repair protein AddB, partial [Alphaproteobacteria bacterium]|nr:double-strand break repair protein AddB [Alphaproteobacteria bacterium]
MSDTRPRVFTIPPHVAFVDALAEGLIARTRDDPMRLARATVLLPNRRAVRALTDAFVRLSGGGGLLLPRMTPIGDIDEDEALGSFADDLFAGADVSPAVDSCERRLLLCDIVRRWRARRGEPATAVEALRLADELARTLDQLEFEEKDALDL